ncbi:MAG: bifunctional methylenetetrahydrofolate dehydrogenase/methenyltetrahydrofolate cyclohydrolase FolD [Ruminococcaceae bacterium]|nr:bifunctional methylenetetrahydrofolate dehydrogenase/methenyltetrahydrofolate cyclohydrolase FolD [Oscillospiraceae bacterium]
MNNIIDGKLVSASVRASVKEEAAKLKEEGINPSLAVILVGNDTASSVYVKNKQKACIETGIVPIQINMPEETAEDELLAKIDELNNDDGIHGILVQLPLPKHISEKKVIERISPKKDVDAFTHESVGRIVEGKYSFLPCTPAGIMKLLEYYKVDIQGKECVIIGRSNIVGKPMALLMLNASGTVTVCHSKTKNLAEVTKRADILVVAIGKAEFVTSDMVKEGAVVIDVGINRMPDGKLKGDVEFEGVSKIASLITPVPGGVGPMTISMLMQNTVFAAKNSSKA